MNIVSRIANQSAINYYQISGSRRVDDPTRSPRGRTKTDRSFATASLFRGFYSTTKLPGSKRSTGVARISDDIADDIAAIPPITSTAAKQCMNEPRIRFDEYRINLKAEMFKFCLVGKFPTAVAGATLEQVKEMASGEWNLQGNCSITLLDQSHLFIRLENEVDMIRVWPRNQWSCADGEVMKIFKWTPMFRPSDGELPTAAVWLTLPSLPVVFYQEDLLLEIASLVGKVLGVDDATRNLTRTDSARVCVEVDLLKELPSKVWIEVGEKGFWQTIEYEEKPCFCTFCSTVGHKTSSCEKKIEKAAIDDSKKHASRFEIKNCDARVGYYHTTPLFGEIEHAHSFRGGSEIMVDERNGDIIGSSSGQDVENVNSDAVIEVSKNCNQPTTKPVVTIKIEELLDAEKPVTIHISSEQGKMEMGTIESVSKTQNPENGDHGASSSKAKQSYQIRSNHTARKQRWWKRVYSPEKPLSPGYSTRRFSFAEMKAASKCFKELIGEGGFGKVYKGKLGNNVVAIKRWSSDSHQGLKEFETELVCGALGYCGHMVALVGYCNENDELLLAYEYMSNGDLGKHLFDKNKTPRLSWEQRLVICIGAARGLHHLHSNAVIHRDVKPGNILMDHNWEAKLTDLGISKLAMVNHQGSTHFSTRVMGTHGYADPYYIMTGHLSYQSDVYSFGVVMLEILFGRKLIKSSKSNFDEWRKSCHQEKILKADIAADLKGKVSPECLKEYSALALKCLAGDKSVRPGMREVIDKLQFVLQLHRDYERQRQ